MNRSWDVGRVGRPGVRSHVGPSRRGGVYPRPLCRGTGRSLRSFLSGLSCNKRANPLEPGGLRYVSPGRSAAKPWVRVGRKNGALKGRDRSRMHARLGPFRALSCSAAQLGLRPRLTYPSPPGSRAQATLRAGRVFVGAGSIPARSSWFDSWRASSLPQSALLPEMFPHLI